MIQCSPSSLLSITTLWLLGQLFCSLRVESRYQTVSQIVYDLADETPADSLIGNIAESLEPNMADPLVFVLITSKQFQYFSDFFHITSTGDLRTLKPIDRDNTNEICGPLSCCALMVCRIEANVVAKIEHSRGSYTAGSQSNGEDYSHSAADHLNIRVLIRINDANDNAPRFLPATTNEKGEGTFEDPRPFSIYLREGDPSGMETLPLAVDKDALPNGIVTYSLIQTGTHMQPSLNVSVTRSLRRQSSNGITLDAGEMHISIPKLIQTRPLDYENPVDRELHATLFAIDGGEPSLTGSLSVVVHLLDINDNSPVFQHTDEEVYVTIPENSTMNGKPIFIAKAEDADSAENGRITYSISQLAGALVTKKFSVNSFTGAILVREPLDYEIYSERQFVLPLIAKDAGSPQRSATTTVYVKTHDVNDNEPSIVVQENNTIPEGQFLTKPVIKFYVKDEDESSHGEIKCHPVNQSEYPLSDPDLIAGNQFLRLHGVSDTVFFVFTKSVLDYEATPRASLLIECTDMADSTSPNDPNHKRQANYILRVTAAVADRNDNVPEFRQSRYYAKLTEHAPLGTQVIQVEAQDADSGEFGDLTYQLGTISSSSSPALQSTQIQQQPFRIDSESGRIEVFQPQSLDRELAETLYVQIVAGDRGGLLTTAELIVELTDINDCAPTLTGKSSFYLEENQRVDTIIGHVHFVDKDRGLNGQIHIRPVGGTETEVRKYIRLAPDPLFPYATKHTNQSASEDVLIGDREVRAVLISQMPVDRETYATLFFEIVAFDQGQPMHSVTSTITVQIMDKNDNVPIATFPLLDTTVGYHPPVYVNSPLGSMVSRLRATDIDQGENGTVQFHIRSGTNGTDLFRLNTSTGELTTAWIPHKIINDMGGYGGKPIHQDSTPQQIIFQDHSIAQPQPGVYSLEVVLSDRGFPSNTRHHRFYVHIDQENPNIPDSTLGTSPSGMALETKNSLSNRGILGNRVLLVLIILLGTFTLLSISAIMCWIKLCRKKKVIGQKREYLNTQSDYNPIGTVHESNATDYFLATNGMDKFHGDLGSTGTGPLSPPHVNMTLGQYSQPEFIHSFSPPLEHGMIQQNIPTMFDSTSNNNQFIAMDQSHPASFQDCTPGMLNVNSFGPAYPCTTTMRQYTNTPTFTDLESVGQFTTDSYVYRAPNMSAPYSPKMNGSRLFGAQTCGDYGIGTVGTLRSNVISKQTIDLAPNALQFDRSVESGMMGRYGVYSPGVDGRATALFNHPSSIEQISSEGTPVFTSHSLLNGGSCR